MEPLYVIGGYNKMGLVERIKHGHLSDQDSLSGADAEHNEASAGWTMRAKRLGRDVLKVDEQCLGLYRV